METDKELAIRWFDALSFDEQLNLLKILEVSFDQMKPHNKKSSIWYKRSKKKSDKNAVQFRSINNITNGIKKI